MDEWFTNVVLYRRYTNIILWNIFIQSFVIWSIKLLGFLLSPAFGVLSLSLSTAIYCQIYLTVLVCGLCFLFFKNVRVYPELPGTPLSILYSFLRPHSWIQSAVFVILGALWSHCLLAIFDNPIYSHLWQQTPACLKDSSKCCVSEHHLFVFLHGAFLGLSFHFAYQVRHLYCLKFQTVQQLKLPTAKASLKKQVKKSLFVVMKKIHYYYLFYYFFGFIPKYVVSETLGQTFCGEVSLTTLSGLFDLGLLWSLSVVGIAVYAFWTTALSLAQIFLTERFSFPLDATMEKDKGKLLTNAISKSNNDLLQHLAFQNLTSVAQHSSASRKKIFAISIPGGHPHTWNEVSNRCLDIIDEFQSSLSQAISASSTNSKALPGSQLNISHYLNQTPETNGVSRYPQMGTQLSPSLKMSSVKSTPSLKSPYKARNMVDQSIAPKMYSSFESKTPIARNNKADLFKGYINDFFKKAIENLMNKPLLKFLTVEPSERKLERLMCRCQLVIWSVNALCFLVRASFTEDHNGVVQWKLSKIISSLLELQMAVERCPKGMLRNSNSRDTLLAPSRSFSLKQSLNAAINSGLYYITCTFKHNLKYIELSDEHRDRIERYLQMKE